MEVKPDYKRTEVGVIPEDWEVTSVGALGTVVRGGSPRPAGDPRYFNGNYIPWLTVAALTNIPEHKLQVTETVGFLTKEGSNHSRTLANGTVIIANSGATLGVAKLLGVTCCANDGIAAIINQRSGDKIFLCYYINSRTKTLREVVATGNGQPNLNTGLIREILIPFPPIPEQHAIATALSDVDTLLEAMDQLIAKKRALKRAATQQLLTGQTRLPGFKGEWEVKRLGDIADTDPENLGSDTSPNFAFNYIALEDVDRGTLRSHTEQVFAKAPSRARRKLRPNDVLVSTVRPNLQSHLLFGGAAGTWVCSTGFCVVRCRQGVTNPAYVFAHLFAAFVNQQIEALLTGSNYPAINSGDVRALRMPVPSYAEQTAIAAVLSDMDIELAALEQRRNKTRALKQSIIQELLTGKTRLGPQGICHA